MEGRIWISLSKPERRIFIKGISREGKKKGWSDTLPSNAGRRGAFSEMRESFVKPVIVSLRALHVYENKQRRRTAHGERRSPRRRKSVKK